MPPREEDPMRTALYFPHTEVRSESIVRTALLTWDSLETIVPFKGYQPNYASPLIAEAMEVIGCPRTPTEAEQGRVHELVEDLLQDGVPEIFRYSPSHSSPPYEVWPQKLAESTWDLLQSRGLTQGRLSNMDYPMSEAAGLSLMAVLADVLAGDTRARVTDRSQAYATIANAPISSVRAQEHDTVVPLTFKAASLQQVPIERLIALRVREAKSGGHDYRRLRHNYLDAIDKHISRISEVAVDSVDRIELDRAFASDMEDDLTDIKQELGFAKGDALFSKEVITLVLAAGALLAAATTTGQLPMPEVIAGGGGAVLLGGLLGTGNKLAKSRRDVLRKHPMAYLYEVQR